MHGELNSLRSQRKAFTGHLDRYPQGFVLTDADGKVLFINRAGRDLLASGSGLRIENGCLRSVSAKEDKTLRHALRDTATGLAPPHRRLRIGRKERPTPYQLLLMPVPTSGAIPLGVAEPAVAILILDAESSRQPDPQLLADLFFLTPAEARVASLLVCGKSVEEAAAELKVSFATVRTHVRKIQNRYQPTRCADLPGAANRTVRPAVIFWPDLIHFDDVFRRNLAHTARPPGAFGIQTEIGRR